MNLFNRNFQIMDISVVIPLYNEDESLPELTAWIERVMAANHFTYEIIMVDDGSSDNSWALIETLSTQNKHIRAIKFRRNYGKSAALHCGFQNAQGDVVITMDADMQDSPDEIPALYQMIMSEDYDMISGWKKKRFDPKSKTIPNYSMRQPGNFQGSICTISTVGSKLTRIKL